MAIRIYKSLTPGTRFCAVNKLINFKNAVQTKKSAIIKGYQRSKGRNNQGRITIRHRGGGHKRLYRKIDFKRKKKRLRHWAQLNKTQF